MPFNKLILISFLIFPSCSYERVKHIDARKFIETAKEMEIISSFETITYLGITKDRAYLEYQLGNHNFTIIYWTELDSLPNHIQSKMKSGNNPWCPWYQKKKDTIDLFKIDKNKLKPVIDSLTHK